MSDIFREVDEEVRQERTLAFLQRYQLVLLAVALLVVATAAGWRFYASHMQARAEADGAAYRSAVQLSRAGKPDEARAILDRLAREGTPGYRRLAALRAADEYVVVDRARALKGFDTLANGDWLDPQLRDLARLRAAMLQLDAGETGDAQARLTPLASGNSPFRNTARELLGVAALSADDFATAGRWLDEIVRDPQASVDIRGRAEAFLALVRAGRGPPDKG